MEIRKVQRLGSSSYIVTLPVSWVKKIGIKPGDSVIILEENNALKIKPNNEEKTINNIFKIDIRDINESIINDRIIDCLFSHGYNIINIEYKGISYSSLLNVIERLKEKYNMDIKIKENKVQLFHLNNYGNNTKETLKEIAKTIIEFIEKPHDTTSNNKKEREQNSIEKLLEIKFSDLKKVTFQELKRERENEAKLLAIIEQYTILNELFLISRMIVDVFKSFHDIKEIDTNDKSKIISMFSNAIWELYAGIANESVKRIKYAKNTFEKILNLLENIVTDSTTIQTMKIILEELISLSNRLESCSLYKSMYSKIVQKKREFYSNEKEVYA